MASGDFDSKEMAGLLEQGLGSWRVDAPRTQPDIVLDEPETTTADRQLYLIDRPGATQVSISVAQYRYSQPI